MKRIATLAVGIALIVPGTALAQGSSTCQAYSPQLCSVISQSSTQGPANSSTATQKAGTLPFTGLDVALLAVGGASLLGGGLVVRRLSRSLN